MFKNIDKGLSKEGKKVVNTPRPYEDTTDIRNSLNENDRKIFEENVKKEAQKEMKKILSSFKKTIIN